jgi:hypothetical protein
MGLSKKATHVLNVHYNPVFVIQPNYINFGIINQTITIMCLVNSNPPPTHYLWFKKNNIVGYTHSLTLILTNSTTGTYKCHVLFKNLTMISNAAVVDIFNKPSIISLYTYTNTTHISIVCKTYSPADYFNITWYYNNKIFDTDTFLSPKNITNTKSIIIDKYNILERYGCLVKNKYGHITKIIHVNHKSQKCETCTTIGIITTILIVVIIITILIVIFIKKKLC